LILRAKHRGEGNMEYDFGRSAIDKLVKSMDFLHHTSYWMNKGRASPDTGLMCMDDPGSDQLKWDGLGRTQRVEVLNRYIDWTHFEPDQVDAIIDNIASGKERMHWFDGVPMGWRGVSEREHQGWLEFEKLPEEEQLREAARRMKRSETLGGDGVMVHAKWEEMNDRQREDVILHQLRRPEGSDMSYRQWKEILMEELGYWPGEEPVRAEQRPLPSPGQIARDAGIATPERSHGQEREQGTDKTRGR
jgi:hypothetical protein